MKLKLTISLVNGVCDGCGHDGDLIEIWRKARHGQRENAVLWLCGNCLAAIRERGENERTLNANQTSN